MTFQVAGAVRTLLALALVALLSPALAQPVPLWVFPAQDQVAGLVLSSNETLVATQGGGLALLNRTGALLQSRAVGLIQRMAAPADMSSVVTASGLEVTLWSRAFDPRWTYRAPEVVEAVAVADLSARVAVGTRGGTVVLLDSAGTQLGGVRLGGAVERVGLSGDGALLAVSIPGELILFDGQVRERGRVPARDVTALTLSRNGSLIALGSAGGSLSLLDKAGAAVWSHAPDAPVKVSSLGLSREGSLLLAGASTDATAYGPGRSLLWRHTFLQPVAALGLSPDGSRFAAAVRGGLVQVFETGFREASAPAPTPSPVKTVETPTPSPAPRGGPPPTPPPAAPLPPIPFAGAAAAAALFGGLIVLHRRGLLWLPGLPEADRALRALPRTFRSIPRALRLIPNRLASILHRTRPKRPPPAPEVRRPPPPPSRPLRTPPVKSEVARLLRERAREERTLENIERMREQKFIDEARHRALKEEAEGRLAEVKRKLEEAGYPG